jgi:hypothetical protein
MEVSLGALFGTVILIQTILIFSPLTLERGEFSTPVYEIQNAIDFTPYGLGSITDPGVNVPVYYPAVDNNYQNWTTLWTVGTVIPALIVYKKGGNFGTVFSVGLLGWIVSKVIQALTYKGLFYKFNPSGENPIVGSPQVRAMHFWQRAFELTAYGTMAAAFITLRHLAI